MGVFARNDERSERGFKKNDSFIGIYHRIRNQVDGYSSSLSEQDDQRLRLRRVEEIATLIDAFGMAPAAEIEAWSLRTLGRELDEMLSTLYRYISTGVSDCEYLETSLPDNRLQLRSTAARLECWALYWKGNLLYANDKYAEAMSTFYRVLTRDPEFPRRESIFNSLGMAWEHIVGDFDRAEAMYTEVLNIRRRKLDMTRDAGIPTLAKDRDLPIVGVPGQLELTPVEALAQSLERRGDVLMKRGDYGRAVDDFREAHNLRGNDPVLRRKYRRARWYQVTRVFGRKPL